MAIAKREDRREEKVPNRFARGSAGNAGHIPDIPFAPGLAPMLWNPFLGAHAETLGAFGTIAREWQDFVGRRLKEDVSLMERLARCSTPDQVISVYTEFWRKAGEDYSKAISTMAGMITDVAGKMALAAQPANPEANAWQSRRQAA